MVVRWHFLILTLLPTFISATDIKSILIHPPFSSFYSCSEHWQGQFESLGDSLGADCVVKKLVDIEGRTWLRQYAAEGSTNEEWYGWNQDVLSPCECSVVKVHINLDTNAPGVLGKPPASHVILKRDDGVHLMVAHIQSINVGEKDRLLYGQPFAKVGNNGYSRHPHIHIGAWKDASALQIRFDQTRMKGQGLKEKLAVPQTNAASPRP